jgi:hypothetical protein
MARTSLSRRTVKDPRDLRTEINSHKATLDGMEAGTSFKILGVAAGNGAGARTATGAAVGDRVLGIWNHTDGATATASFESVVTVVDQIQQTATNLTGDTVILFLLTPVS